MDSPSKKIAQNTGYYTMALIIQKIISFIYFSYLATQIGPSGTAKYFFSISFVTIFSVFLDLGLSSLLNREIAKNTESDQKIFSNILGIKLINSIFIVLAIFITAQLLNYNFYLKKMIYLSTAIMLIDSFTMSFFAVLRGKHNLKFESISSVIFQLIVIISGYLTLQKTKEPFLLLLVLLLASSFNLIYSGIVLIFKYRIKVKSKFDKYFIKQILITTWPFALAAIFMKISGSIDSIFLSKLSSGKTLGYYALAYKLTFTFQFIPLAFVASLYPAFTHFWNYEREKLKNIFNKSLIYLSIISIPISIGVIVLAPYLIIKIYGSEFSNSILTLQILICNLPFLFLTFPMGALLNASNLQKKHTRNIFITMLFSITANLILIPIYAQNGSASASLLATLTYLTLNTITCRTVVKINFYKITAQIVKIIISSIIMALIVKILILEVNLFLSALVGALVYPVIAYIFKVFTKKDILFLRGILHKN